MSRNRFNRRETWAYVGSRLNAPTFVSLDSGKVKHVGENLLTGKPQVFNGTPSVSGAIGREIVKRILGQK